MADSPQAVGNSGRNYVLKKHNFNKINKVINKKT